MHRAQPPAVSPDHLVREWVVGVIERTSLGRVHEVDLGLLASEGAPLVTAILERLGPGRGPQEPPADARRRARQLARLRPAGRAPAEVPRDLAVLQSVLIASLHRRSPGPASSDFGRSVQRLAEIFGSLQGAVAEELAREGDAAPATERAAALPGSGDLDRWLSALAADYRRYGRPFALALLELEGLERIIETHGRRSGELMLTAASTMIRSQIRAVDHAFQVDEDALCVLAPSVDAGRLRRMADRLAHVVEASQAADPPRVTISAGVSACPEHGDHGGRLLEVAGEALSTAKATGEPVRVAARNG